MGFWTERSMEEWRSGWSYPTSTTKSGRVHAGAVARAVRPCASDLFSLPLDLLSNIALHSNGIRDATFSLISTLQSTIVA